MVHGQDLCNSVYVSDLIEMVSHLGLTSQGRSQGGFGGFGRTTPQEVNKKKSSYTCIAA